MRGRSKLLRLELNSKGVVDVLKDPGVAADIARRAEAIASAMPEGEWSVSSFTGRDRAQSFVRSADAAARQLATDKPAAVIAALGAGRS